MNVQLGTATVINGWSESSGVYHNLYGDIPANVASWIESDIKQIAEVTKKKQITLLDYGCGTGRYFPLYAKIAEKHGLEIKCLAFEPTLDQLVKCETHLREWGFSLQNNFPQESLEARKSELESKNCSAGFRGPEYRKKTGKGALVVELVHGNIDPSLGATYTPKYLEKQLFGADHIDYGLCLFGVLSYIMGDKNRAAMLKTLGNLVSGPVRVSIPTRNRDQKLYDRFEDLRYEHFEAQESGDYRWIANVEKEMKHTREHGETMTPFPAENGKKALHPYYYTKNTDEFDALIRKAGFKDYEISASNIWPEAYITQENFRNLADAMNTATLDKTGMDKQAMFLMAKIQGKKALDAGFPPVTAVDPKTLPYTVIQGPYSRQVINTPKPTAKAV